MRVRRYETQLWRYEQIFQVEQFAQGADDFDGFLLAAHRTKPLIHVPPWRRPPEPHGVGNEGRCLGERTKWSRFSACP